MGGIEREGDGEGEKGSKRARGMGRERERYSRVSPGDKAPAGGVEDAAAASQGEGRLIRHLRLRYGN